MKNADKKMALNSEIRNSLGKGAGDLVNVTLYLEDRIHVQTNENEMIFECFKDAEVLVFFKQLKVEEQKEIIESINSVATENQKADKIIKVIAKLEKQL